MGTTYLHPSLNTLSTNLFGGMTLIEKNKRTISIIECFKVCSIYPSICWWYLVNIPNCSLVPSYIGLMFLFRRS